jgi:alkaline phosphatase D
MFTWADADFFLLDNRTNRDIRDKDGKILGEYQFKWLIDALRFSEAKFKFVCIGGQFLNTVAKFENHAVFAKERQALIDAIDTYKIKNIIFLTGDRHHSEVSKYITPNGITIHDFTSSSLTSGAGPHEEDNQNRIEGSMIGQRNFAIINVTGSKENRKLYLEYKDSNGKSLYNYEIKPEK